MHRPRAFLQLVVDVIKACDGLCHLIRTRRKDFGPVGRKGAARRLAAGPFPSFRWRRRGNGSDHRCRHGCRGGHRRLGGGHVGVGSASESAQCAEKKAKRGYAPGQETGGDGQMQWHVQLLFGRWLARRHSVLLQRELAVAGCGWLSWRLREAAPFSPRSGCWRRPARNRRTDCSAPGRWPRAWRNRRRRS